jgi:hypothetical protein
MRLGAMLALLAIGTLAHCMAPEGETGAPEPAEVVAWRPVESLRIGSPEGGDYRLKPISALLPAPDGSVYVWQLGEQEVPQFGADGRLMRVIGGDGDGPGELRTIAGFGLLGDTLWISDIRSEKLSYFTADGEHVFDQYLEPLRVPSRPYLQPTPPRLLAGVWATITPYYTTAYPGTIEHPIFKTDRYGTVFDTLSFWDHTRGNRLLVIEGRARWIPKPFSAPREYAASPAGRYFALYVPEDALAGVATDSVAGTLVVYDAAFDTVVSRRLTAPAEVVPASRVRAAYAAFAAQIARNDPERAAGILADMMEGVEQIAYPLTDEILVSDSGETWMRVGYPQDGPRLWRVLGAGGEDRAELTIPAGVTIEAVTDGAIWAIGGDELGVPYIVRYALERVEG